MARVVRIEKARASKRSRLCKVCRAEVQVGEPYKRIDKKTGARSSVTLIWCKDHEPRNSDRLSGRAAELAMMEETLAGDVAAAAEGDYEGLGDAIESFGDSVEGFAQEIQESAAAIVEGFGHETGQSEAMAETAQAFDEWVQEIRDAAATVREAGEDEDAEWESVYAEAESATGEAPELNLQG